MILRRTKIVATLGPATDSPEVLKNIFREGVDVVRLNFSHGTVEDQVKRAKRVREVAKSLGREIGILADLQGPKIRVAKFKNGKTTLVEHAIFCLDAALDKEAGDDHVVGIDYPELPQDVFPEDILLLDDGRIVLHVVKVSGTRIECKVVEGGILSNNKGINRQGGGLSAPALTEKDKSDIQALSQIDVDYVAISFVRSADDIHYARKLLNEAGVHAGIVAKIERIEAVSSPEILDDIIRASEAVMVARGDLGVEVGDAQLPGIQKKIIQRARSLDRLVITATQMMESMIQYPIPTRAEVFDVANAVLDGTDAVMLSAETATGNYPEKVVAAMARVCVGAEKERSTQVSGHRLECEFERIDETIAMAAMYTANHLKVKGIIALTESGSTPRWMSRIRSGIPIYAFSRHIETLRKMTLFRGVYPVWFDVTTCGRGEINQKAVQVLETNDTVTKGDCLVITKGDFMGVNGGSNTLKIVVVGEVI